MNTLLVDGAKYHLWTPEKEEEFHPMIKEHSKEIFGENSIYLPIEEFLISPAGRGVMPDGFAIVFSQRPEMYIVEVELSSHDLDKHIIEQINRFVRAIKNPENSKKIADDIEDKIRSNPMDEAFVKQQIGNKEIYKFLSDLVSQPPKIVIIIENKDDKLIEACENLKVSPIIREFKTYVREGAPTVHAHLFEPIYPSSLPSKIAIEKPLTEVGRTMPLIGEVKAGDSLEIALRVPSEKKFAYFHIDKENRRFFPGYKKDFALETDIGDIKTRVTSAHAGAQVGDPDAGVIVQGNLKQWYGKHQEANIGTKVRFDCIDPYKRYKLSIV